MTFNDKGFQPLMALNSAHLRAVLRALARCHSLLFTAIVRSELPNILKLLNPNTEQTNRGVRTVRSCSVVFGWCNPQAIMLARLRRPFTAPPRKYQSRHKCPKGVLKICEQAPIFNLAFCTYGVRPLLRSAQSQRSGVFG